VIGRKPSWRMLGALALLAYTGICVARAIGAGAYRGEAPQSSPDGPSVYLPLVASSAAPPAASTAASSSVIATSPADGAVWVVNPDAGSVTRLEPSRLGAVAEVPIGGEPWSLAIAPDGRSVYVVDRAAGTLVVVDAQRLAARAIIPIGPEPGTVALNAAGTRAYVTVSSTGDVAIVDTQRLAVVARVAVGPHPYALAVVDSPGQSRVYVTHLLSRTRLGGIPATDDGQEGYVTVLDGITAAVVGEITLPPDVHGFPNALTGIAVHGTRAWVPMERAAPALPNGLTTTVFAAVSALDLTRNDEDVSAQLALNDLQTFGSPVNNPVASIPAPDGLTVYVVLAGSDVVEIVDVSTPTQPRLVGFLPAGHNPRGMALSRDGHWGFVMSYLSRTVTVLDLRQRTVTASVPVTAETLDPALLRGKILFNTAADPRLTRGGWIACASCHIDGGADGVTWMFPDGPRQTPPLWNAGRTLPWHWSAALDEPQDIEFTIRVIQFGLGLAPQPDPPLLGAPIAGRSADLDALAAYVAGGIRAPAVAPPAFGAAHGRQLFVSAGCTGCHGGPQWTSSAETGPAGMLDPDGNGMVDATLHDVGTLDPRDVRGATGFDPPSLLGVGLTVPYLHDGSMPTLAALLAVGHPSPHGNGNGLRAAGIADLVAFLNAIGPDMPPLEPITKK
jgi:YVTN family beta-propeller protein